ncbi:MAG: lysine--tRNA ligase [Rhodospirillaceae bacterium]|nr:lysine--tRNA ligase [Rhodospirillaceae bacterium]|tara:strand:- start:40 stop:1629 length:1590 start_codon:yes stop_codon:yes gene_type:complete
MSKISKEVLDNIRAWPHEEARKIVKRLCAHGGTKKEVILETGYGPSGLPHIGTFGEVFRTTMVRNALQRIIDTPSRIIAFSDDMDGLRKVPENIPNPDLLEKYLNRPLTKIPDPFGTHESFGQHNNAMLKGFLDSFGFDYEFLSSTECYTSGKFDEVLLQVLENYDKIMKIMLPTLGQERKKTYSPFLPICPETGQVLQVPITEKNAITGTIIYEDPSTFKKVEVPVTGGHCKLQWKVDWAMRWKALGVDYEMCGKDLIDSVTVSSKICRALDGEPPENLIYELFLDETGQKISKSRGNGIAVEEWLKYGPPESLSLFMFQQPKRAKRLYFDVIPKNTDEYLSFRSKIESEDLEKKAENPTWHIHNENIPTDSVPLSFNLLLNLASVCHAEDTNVIWGYIKRYSENASADTNLFLDKLAAYAVNYYKTFIRPAKVYRLPNIKEKNAISDLATALQHLSQGSSAEEIQTVVYEVGKKNEFDNLRNWFKALYQILLGQDQGPRFGSFVALYGISETIKLINRALDGEDLST